MTEEMKCNFQQNYNVFGLDDKPCCYLFHKYCNEVEDCEHKQLLRLQQENQALRRAIKDVNIVAVCEELEKLKQENEELGKIIDSKNGTIATLAKTRDSLKQENFALTQESQQKSQTICELKQENEKLKKYIIAVENDNDWLTALFEGATLQKYNDYRSALEEIREIASDALDIIVENDELLCYVGDIYNKINEALNESKQN